MKTIKQIQSNARFPLLWMGRVRWFGSLVGLLLFAACSGDDYAGGEDIGTDGQRFSVSVTDGGYSSTEKGLQTRAIENGYTTEFTTGDRMGVFAVKDGTIRPEVNNLCLIASDNAGTLEWKDVSGNAPLKFSGATYYAYYPYQATLMGSVDDSADDAAGFFAGVINSWAPGTDQGTYSKYTAQDLMVAMGSIGSNGLSFTMEHQMALVVIYLPGTKYEFANNNPTVPDYIADPVNPYFDNYSPCRMTDGTYRYLVKPSQTTKLTGGYTDASDKAKGWEVTPDSNGGNYKTYTIDYGMTTVTNYTLQAGDFMLKDGSLIGKGETLTSTQRANCIGVVFWVGDPTKGNHDNGTVFSDFGDPALKTEQPQCTHGLIVALQDASASALYWQRSSSDVGSWTSSKTIYGSIATGTGADDPLNKLRGYNNTQAIRAYNDAELEANKKVSPVGAIDTWAASNPSPANSSGWYLPSEKELSLLCGQDVNNLWVNNSGGTGMRDIVNASLLNVGSSAAKIASTWYWSSSESAHDYAWIVLFSDGHTYASHKSNASRVRAVSAF